MFKFEIYCATNTVSGKSYFGASCNYRRRWRGHLSSARRGSPLLLYAAIRKYGPDTFLVERITTADTKGEAMAKERWFIAAYNTFGPDGYNMTPGGETPDPEQCRAYALEIHARPEFKALRAENARRRRRNRLARRARQRRAEAKIAAMPMSEVAVRRGITGTRRDGAGTSPVTA
jgi:group I intron endonuclease